MPNPARPNEGETVASEWGRSVAEHVVRRYGSRAERDIDWQGLTPEAGALVVIAPPTSVPWFEQFDGAVWRPTDGGVVLAASVIFDTRHPANAVQPVISFSLTYGWQSGGFTLDTGNWLFPGDSRGLIVPRDGFYAVSGMSGVQGAGGWFYCQTYRYRQGGAGINAQTHRASIIQGTQSDVSVPAGQRSTLAGMIPANAGDVLGFTVDWQSGAPIMNQAVLFARYAGGFPAGYTPPAIPAGLEGDEVPELLPEPEP